MSGSMQLQLQLERALALAHAALADATEARATDARQAARDVVAAIGAARRGSSTLSQGHDLLEGLARLQLLVRLLDRGAGAERVA